MPCVFPIGGIMDISMNFPKIVLYRFGPISQMSMRFVPCVLYPVNVKLPLQPLIGF